MELSELRKTPHLSASTITTYIDCSLQYYFSRVKRLPMEFVSDALSFGTVIHLVLAEFYKAKMAGERLSLKDVHQLYRQFWTREAKDSQEIKYAEGKDFNTYLMQGCDVLSAWFNKLPDDNFSVVAIEEAFVFDVDGIPIPIIGAIDLVEEDEAGTIIITDFKTSSRVYSIFEIDQNPQITRYQMAAKVNGFADREILLKFDCLVKTKTPKFEQYYTTRTETDELRLIRIMQRVWDGIGKEVFIPAQGASGNVATEDVVYMLDGLGIRERRRPRAGVRGRPLHLRRARARADVEGREVARGQEGGVKNVAPLSAVTAQASGDDVPSPCINVCRMNEATRLCEGCLRTLDEIACWSGYTREEKLAVPAKLDARKRATR